MIPHVAAIALTVALMAGCTTPAFHHKDVNRHVVVLDQMPVSVLQTAENSWEAWGGRRTPEAQQYERQIKAIEIVSGCTIQTSTVDPSDARRLSATVECVKPNNTL